MTPQNHVKKDLRACQSFESDTFPKSFACKKKKLHNTRPKGSMLIESLTQFFVPRRIRPRGTTFEFEYICKLKTEFEKKFGL
jgi:hypothetical protein